MGAHQFANGFAGRECSNARLYGEQRATAGEACERRFNQACAREVQRRRVPAKFNRRERNCRAQEPHRVEARDDEEPRLPLSEEQGGSFEPDRGRGQISSMTGPSCTAR